MNLKIIILPRGWVMVGQVEEKETKVFLENGSVICRWGTSEGLPELANNGPLKDTKLDGKCRMQFPISSIIAMLDCNSEAWKNY